MCMGDAFSVLFIPSCNKPIQDYVHPDDHVQPYISLQHLHEIVLTLSGCPLEGLGGGAGDRSSGMPEPNLIVQIRRVPVSL